MNPTDKISKYCSFSEATFSQNAMRSGIDNTPNEEQLEAMIYVATEIFDPVREMLGEPLTASSFFRSPQLNSVTAGSSKTSQHQKGEAIDMYCAGRNAEIFWWIKENADKLDLDQCIWEFGNDKEPAWVHCSKVKYRANRKEFLKAYHDAEGNPKYGLFDLEKPK